MSLRLRLLTVLVALLGLGLVVADTVTYRSLRSYLVTRVDQQVQMAEPFLSRQLGAGLPYGGPPGGRDGGRPGGGGVAGTYGALVAGDGTVLARSAPMTPTGTTTASPSISAVTTAAHDALAAPTGATGVRTVDGAGGVDHYRLEARAAPDGQAVVVAVPLSEVESTTRRLLRLMAAISAAVVLALALAAFLIVRAGLRPLSRMAATADAIAAGDLSRRVDARDERTEVGRLGTALNAMLTQIEAGFAARAATESRLRRFVADASHELRTPLTSIRGYAEMFGRGAAERPADLATVMRRIEGEATRMGGLVEDMLLLARLDQGRAHEAEPVDLHGLAEDAALDAEATDEDRCITVRAEGACTVLGDEHRLRQAVGNLVRNALVHTPAGTPVELQVWTGGDRVVLAVVDHGPGVPPEAAERVFERFFRADPGRSRDSGGSGLGLSVVAAVATGHGGQVRLGPTPGGGATFVLDLPAACVGPPAGLAREAPPALPAATVPTDGSSLTVH